jgi:hypothetical protein
MKLLNYVISKVDYNKKVELAGSYAKSQSVLHQLAPSHNQEAEEAAGDVPPLTYKYSRTGLCNGMELMFSMLGMSSH